MKASEYFDLFVVGIEKAKQEKLNNGEDIDKQTFAHMICAEISPALHDMVVKDVTSTIKNRNAKYDDAVLAVMHECKQKWDSYQGKIEKYVKDNYPEYDYCPIKFWKAVNILSPDIYDIFKDYVDE